VPPSAAPKGPPGPRGTAPLTSSSTDGPAVAGPWPPGARWPSSSPWPWSWAPRPVVPASPPLTGRLLQLPAGGFEVTAPAGWTDLSRSRRVVTPGSGLGSAVGLRPMRRAANTMVMLHTGSLSSAQYPGTEPGGGGQDSSFGADQTTGRLEDRGGTLGRGRPPDGRPYVWQQTLLGTNQVARYAIAWPYHCTPQQACPRAPAGGSCLSMG
jgi:hypothetical protein